jgi:hypothetical protein
MRIAYITTDEVNQSLAEKFARRQAHTAVAAPADETPRDAGFDAVIYDLDYLPADVRDDIVETLVMRPCRLPTAVHGYNISPRSAKALHANGVLVYRRLQPGMFRKLAQVANQMWAPLRVPRLRPSPAA